MSVPPGVLDRGVPDVVDTSSLPVRLAVEIDYLAGRTAVWADPSPAVPAGVRARALVVEGRNREAHDLLLSVADAGFVDEQDRMAAIWAASRVGGPTVLEVLASPEHDLQDGFVSHDGIPLGPQALAAGLLATIRGDLDEASTCLGEAVTVGDRRAPVWGALARVELSRVKWTAADLLPLSDRGRATVVDEARRLALAARTFFVAGGYRHLVRSTASLFGSAEALDRAEPRLGHLVEGDVWSVGFGASPPVTVPTSKGLLALRHLLRNPGRQVPAMELDVVADGGDPERIDASRLRAELEAGELEASELHRLLLDPTARSRTSKLLRRTVDRLGKAHPVLGRHFAATVRTGYACSYEGDFGVVWRL
ncbi:MAG: hypothetical protein KDB02_12490 [Acidimicrobiales bacterium]|nr:hypothetical protein [Acidimicrobiales bacterium]